MEAKVEAEVEAKVEAKVEAEVEAKGEAEVEAEILAKVSARFSTVQGRPKRDRPNQKKKNLKILGAIAPKIFFDVSSRPNQTNDELDERRTGRTTNQTNDEPDE